MPLHADRKLLVLLPALLGLVAGLFFGLASPAHQPEPPKKDKMIAGKAEVLKAVPKKFAAFVGYDAANHRVTLHREGDTKPTTWAVKPDGEIKVLGWWGRLDQFVQGDRVWAWFMLDRDKKPKAILMLADEISEQDIHRRPYIVAAVDLDKQSLTVEVKGSKRTLKLPKSPATPIKVGEKRFVQSAGDQARLLFTPKELEFQREKQKAYLAAVWRKHGLAATVGFLHPLGGEMEVMLDHEGIRWGRYLKPGDKVTLTPATNGAAFKPITTVVKKVQPWREYTRVLLVSDHSFDQADLTLGQRLGVVVPEPPPEVQKSPWPTDMDRPRTKEERIEWFLATVYCTCKVGGDQCTGMFYVQSSCNVNSCGMPNNIKNQVTKMIDKGLTDQQILEALLKTRGPELLKPHLLP